MRLDRQGNVVRCVPVGLRRATPTPARAARLRRRASRRRPTAQIEERAVGRRLDATTASSPRAGRPNAHRRHRRAADRRRRGRRGRSCGRCVADRRRWRWSGCWSSPGSSSGAACCRSSGSRGTAEQIAAATCRTGRASRTTTPRSGGSGTAFDAMLDQIEASFAEQQARPRGEGAQRGPAPAVRRRRLARAAHAAHGRPRLRGPVPRRRPRRSRRARRRRWTGSGPRAGGWARSSTTCCCSRASTRGGRSAATPSTCRGSPRTPSPTRARWSRRGRSWTSIEPGVVGRRRRGPAAPGRRQPARQRAGPHAGRRRRWRSSLRARRRRRPSCASSTTARASTPSDGATRVRPLLPRRSRPLARQRRHGPRAVDRRVASSPRTAAGCGTSPRPAAARRSSSGSRSQASSQPVPGAAVSRRRPRSDHVQPTPVTGASTRRDPREAQQDRSSSRSPACSSSWARAPCSRRQPAPAGRRRSGGRPGGRNRPRPRRGRSAAKREFKDTALTTVLDDLVAKGTITAAQKQAILDGLPAERDARIADAKARRRRSARRREQGQGLPRRRRRSPRTSWTSSRPTARSASSPT